MKKIKISKDILKELYLNQRLSMAKTAKKICCDPSSVQRYLRKYKIKSRNLSEATQKIFISEKIK